MAELDRAAYRAFDLRQGNLGLGPGDPSECSDERPLEEYLLERAAIARARGEQQVLDAVTTARSKGISWQRIGDILGTSAQAAQQRYGAAVESA